ncbi:putative aminopeptidase [Leptomonas pyrrhocoris]|uniref:Putative aminopeptidase n=1 Tax=Leptomonas pyrrhocoris TaxID=157538 RepID=A0A0N0VD13_LEPPY|nr:putative aminopeptidase [Leptomonas pyrrhocoris]XP_015652813.1 putative aminopeptidase [Leptomonas pyrrhocoris]KPA74373.1 putative aminopeptidase [Leptomonas pyrrhocoris]KPA74374.1 putative aminopeptidase [Leptomonas pyrrhocoris]|eukprot:XP_015652812.1 putative aminopeptidase [Leptomonas pyrrhocoris]
MLSLDKKQKKKGNMNNKSSTAASNAAVENASVDWGSKLVLFERCDTLPLHSEVELTVQFTGTVQAFDHGGIYAARTEGTSNSAEDRALLTHLEVRFARCAFPCPDDPQYRLDWQLKSVQLPDSYTAVLTNGEEQGRRALTAQRAVQRSFAPCGPLPAYSFSFACFPEPLEEVASTMAIPEFAGGIAEGLQSHAGTIPCATIPVRVLARRQARIPAATLERVLHITKEAVATLQQRFDCPLPLLQCRHLDVLLGPTMPFISGMEHHCCIILNETMYQSGKKASGGGGSAEAEQTELIIHELAHHWMGNALGLPFPVKEGVCQVLEQCIGDTLLGKPMRKFKPDSAAVAPAGATGNQDAAVSTKTNPISQMIQAAEKGHEFTGSSYQQALKAIRHFVADRGFAVFERSLRHIVHAQVLLPTIAVEEQGGTQMLRCVGGDVPPPPYLSTEAFLRSMKLLSS